MLSKICRLDFLNRRHSQSAVKKCVGLNSARTRPNLAHFSQQEVVFLNHTSISHYRLTPTKNTHVSSLFHSFAWNWLIQSLSQLNLAHFSQQDVVFLSHISLSLSHSWLTPTQNHQLSACFQSHSHTRNWQIHSLSLLLSPLPIMYIRNICLSLSSSLSVKVTFQISRFHFSKKKKTETQPETRGWKRVLKLMCKILRLVSWD